MKYLIAYDIADAKRLRVTAKICKDYGFRVEYSVFECDLNMERLDKLLSELKAVINIKEDTILCYPICSACEKRIRRLGNIRDTPKKELYIL